jgi:hypothetical protein
VSHEIEDDVNAERVSHLLGIPAEIGIIFSLALPAIAHIAVVNRAIMMRPCSSASARTCILPIPRPEIGAVATASFASILVPNRQAAPQFVPARKSKTRETPDDRCRDPSRSTGTKRRLGRKAVPFGALEVIYQMLRLARHFRMEYFVTSCI